MILFRVTLFTEQGAPFQSDEMAAETKQQFDAYTRNLGNVLADPEGYFTIEVGGATMIFAARRIEQIVVHPLELDGVD